VDRDWAYDLGAATTGIGKNRPRERAEKGIRAGILDTIPATNKRLS
jgi:hypothetical protein